MRRELPVAAEDVKLDVALRARHSRRLTISVGHQILRLDREFVHWT